MSDVSFAARLVVTREVGDDGIPVLTATVIPTPTAAATLLPAGPTGPSGPRGPQMPTFRKMGEIADAAARPTGLGTADRGKWWHRLDTDGMDVWTGAGWTHSPAAVGPQGAPAPATTITASTTHEEHLTDAAAAITGTGPDLTLTVTAPAGLPGPTGLAGASSTITAATDFDATTGPTKRSGFGWSPGARRWRPMTPPGGFGPWSFSQTDFVASTSGVFDKITVATLTMPVLPWRWRPLVFGMLTMYCQSNQNSDVEAYVRIASAEGTAVGMGAGSRLDNWLVTTPIVPAFGDNDGTRAMSPSSTYGTIPANAESQLIVTVERIAGSSTSAPTIEYQNGPASALAVWAIPVGG